MRSRYGFEKLPRKWKSLTEDRLHGEQRRMIATCLPYVMVALGLPGKKALKRSHRRKGMTLGSLHELFVQIGEFLSVADKAECSESDVIQLPERRKKV